jgi:hypothetical protein
MITVSDEAKAVVMTAASEIAALKKRIVACRMLGRRRQSSEKRM